MSAFKLDCVLFDLDGTLVDTAPDLIASLNTVLAKQGIQPIEFKTAKSYISYGAMAMINHAITDADEQLKKNLLDEMLSLYQENIAIHSRLFDGMLECLIGIEALDLKWGVVTNKRKRFTIPLMNALNLSSRAVCMISGDTTPYAKPHPEPMLVACQQAKVQPENCVYIGDAAHDITAGKAVNMKTLVAVYGYLNTDDQPQNWGADALIEHPQHLLPWIKANLCH